MKYPPAPWRLRGRAVCLFHLLDIARVRAFVSPELSILAVLPGKTLGGIYLAAYQPGSVLEYHELIIIPALVRYRWRLGVWISHIYVDEQRSVAGGRDIWGLPKQWAEFTWDESAGQGVVRQGAQLLCRLCLSQPPFWLRRLPVILPALSRKEEDLLWFQGTGTARLGITRGEVDIPLTSPFSALGFSRGFGIHLHHLELVVSAPVRLTRP